MRWTVAKPQSALIRQVAELETTVVFVLSFQIMDAWMVIKGLEGQFSHENARANTLSYHTDASLFHI